MGDHSWWRKKNNTDVIMKKKITSQSLTREEVISEWMNRGIQDLFLAFKLDEPFSRHSPFFSSMATEMICKAYLLGFEERQYANISFEDGVKSIDDIAKKKFGHSLKKIIKSIIEKSSDDAIKKIIDGEYDSYKGQDLLTCLEKAYSECRYPVPNPIHLRFPIKGTRRITRDPINSSGLDKFTRCLNRQVLLFIRRDFGVQISPDTLDRLRPKRTLIRFKRLFLGGERGLVARRKIKKPKVT